MWISPKFKKNPHGGAFVDDIDDDYIDNDYIEEYKKKYKDYLILKV
jgi:hypothetical protein